MSSAQPLAGLNIVVTRPAGQAAHLAEALVELGARPILFPVLEIFDVIDPVPFQDVAIRLATPVAGQIIDRGTALAQGIAEQFASAITAQNQHFLTRQVLQLG